MMHSRILKAVRIIILVLILPFLAILFSPHNQASAACPVAGGRIKVENGLISTIDEDALAFTAETNVSCVADQRAAIPQFAIQSYDEIKTLYFDQAKSSFSKTTLTGNQTQTTTTSPINLTSF